MKKKVERKKLKKNDISDWITNNFSKDEGEKYKSLKDKSEIIKVLMNFGKSLKKEVVEEKNKTVSKENNINNKDEKIKNKLNKNHLKILSNLFQKIYP